MRYLKLKRIIDFLFSMICIIVLMPLFLFLIFVIKIDSKGPVLFKQMRVGVNKNTFSILKFRTMRIDAPRDTPTHLFSNSQSYITRVGKILRRTSLDELPQLWNILIGQMSFVGPRPALWNQYDLIVERDKYGVNSIWPGLTGWAQVNGRDELSIETKARFDGEYVKNMGLIMDLKCCFKTFKKVLKGDGFVEGHKRNLASK
ncbi:sugar transferase [Cohnella sp. JJ-181]|uniref:sugar transferase n=1 Tax=Cohnella rhizoplanae TaxID=2974897 RepID=UPI00232AE009|nr:sugar transferase [Cohnella sp. JJ-181]